MEFTLNTTIPAPADVVYNAWLDSTLHSAMTGDKAEVSAVVGESFTAWDGYITGTNVELVPSNTIVQSWRTADFTDAEPDSQIRVELKDVDGATELTLTHTNLPEHGEQYRTGWDESYFQPMKEYFGKQ